MNKIEAATEDGQILERKQYEGVGPRAKEGNNHDSRCLQSPDLIICSPLISFTMYFFSHIPKTAGTSLGFIFEYMFNRETFWDYKEKYAPDEELCAHLRYFVNKNYISFIGGHISANQYKPLLAGTDIIYLFTARHPFSHFISKLNHDFQLAICNTSADVKIKLQDESITDKSNGTYSIPIAKVRDFFGIDSIFAIPSLRNYLKAYIEINGETPGARVYPFLTDSLYISLQYFMWNEARNGMSLIRKDPAMINPGFNVKNSFYIRSNLFSMFNV